MPNHSADVGKLVEELIQKHQAEADDLALSEKVKYGDSSTVSTYTWVHSMKAMSQKFVRDLLDIQTVLDNVPTISPDDVGGVGEWEQKEIFGVEETTIEQMQSACCSVCGKYHTTPYLYYFSKYNYCPSCGARLGNGGTDDS